MGCPLLQDKTDALKVRLAGDDLTSILIGHSLRSASAIHGNAACDSRTSMRAGAEQTPAEAAARAASPPPAAVAAAMAAPASSSVDAGDDDDAQLICKLLFSGMRAAYCWHLQCHYRHEWQAVRHPSCCKGYSIGSLVG